MASAPPVLSGAGRCFRLLFFFQSEVVPASGFDWPPQDSRPAGASHGHEPACSPSALRWCRRRPFPPVARVRCTCPGLGSGTVPGRRANARSRKETSLDVTAHSIVAPPSFFVETIVPPGPMRVEPSMLLCCYEVLSLAGVNSTTCDSGQTPSPLSETTKTVLACPRSPQPRVRVK